MESTDWRRYDVPGMWSMVSDFDSGPQWTHVGGWRKAFELSGLHLTRLRSYRDRLVVVWSPERNEASRRYVAELDRLIGSVLATHDAAIENHTALSGATAAMSTARYKLKPLYDEWRSNESSMASFEASVAAGGSGRPVPVPRPAPIPPGWRESLNVRARAVMTAASAEIAEATYRLVRPPDYIAPRLRIANETGPPSDGRSSIRRDVPPIVPRPTPASRPPQAAPRPSEPVLARQSGAGFPPPAARQPESPHELPRRVSVSAVIDPRPVQSKAQSASVGSRPRSLPPSPVNTPTGAPRPLPPGGVIGAQPGPILAASPTSRPAQRTGPIGGVIGPGFVAEAGPPPVTRPAMPGPARPVGASDAVFRTPDGHLVTISDRSTRWSDGRGSQETPDPDDPWAVAEGGPSVIEAPPEPRYHDPGPAIGLDR